MLLPVLVGTIRFLPPTATVVLAAAAALLACREYAALAAGSGVRVFRGVAAAGVVASVFAAARGATTPVLLTALLALAAASLRVGLRGGTGRSADRPLVDVAASVFPLLYLGLPLGVVAALRATGPEAILLLLGLVAASDTAQYYGGRRLGRTPLAAAVSPGKTVEGALFGVAAGGLVMAAAGPAGVGALADAPVAVRVLLGAGLAGLGMAGDLFESLLKRGAGVKDASALIPGHGGLLDRIDSLLFAGPGFHLMLSVL